MKKTLTFCLLLAILFAVSPAQASTPMSVIIDSTMDLNTRTGTFAATGPAVDAGVFCPAGDVFDLDLMATGYQSGNHTNLHMFKRFVCSNGSGEIYLMLNVRIIPPITLSNWVVTDGDGDYTRLKGQGKITATGVDNLVFDLYTGQVHID